MSAEAFIQDQGTFVMSTLVSLPTTKAKAIVHLVVTLFIGLINDIASIVIQHNYNNDANDKEILKVLPYNSYRL